jgi:hypothetical protein
MATLLEQMIEQEIQKRQTVKRGYAYGMEPTAQASPFGCCNFFDHCGDELMTLYFSGQLPLLDWMGFNVSEVCYRTIEFMTYVRPERGYYSGTATPGYLCDPCDDPQGVEWGSCKLTVEDFGRIGRVGPTRDIMKPKKYCITDPIWRLDGTPVTNEKEWDMKFVLDQILNDVNLMMVNGNPATCGQFGGLEYWVKTGYDCSMLDSIVIDFNGNSMAGGAGVTWNGNAVLATYDFIDILLAAYRRINQRIGWAPRLRTQPRKLGEQILVMPTSMINCLLDFFTCWSVCPGELTFMDSYEGRAFRNTLNGGLFGDGRIYLDGKEIPILGYDWGLINGPTLGDIYFLTGSIGSFRIWEGEHISAEVAARENPDDGYSSSDGGRVLWKNDYENECRETKGWIHPRLFNKAPWAQIRFQDVQCVTPGGFMGVDPDETSFYPLTSFNPAECEGSFSDGQFR